MGASAFDACQLTKCRTPGYRSVVFFTQERNIHLNIAALTEEASVRMSCSSAWKLLLLICVTPHTRQHFHVECGKSVRDGGETQTSEVSCKKTLSPTFTNGEEVTHSQEGRWPSLDSPSVFAGVRWVGGEDSLSSCSFLD